MDNIGLMSETVNFIQGSKRNYDSSTMQGGVYFSKDSKEIFLNGESYGNAVPADEEDLTSVNGALQLKDREVDADNFQSKGYVILRKNLVHGVWRDALGNNPDLAVKGATNIRPTLLNTDEGFEYYDTNLKKKILWNGTTWVNLDNTNLDTPINE